MNLFDILGPVMVGPSSSHTAGAVRLGRTARRLLGEGTPRSAAITLYGSFAATGHGHGTDRALIAGLLGFQPDDERIAHSFDCAHDAGMAFTFTLSVYSMIISLIRQLVVLIPCAYLIGMLTGDVTGVWWAFVVAEVVSLTVSALYLRRVNRDVIQTL